MKDESEAQTMGTEYAAAREISRVRTLTAAALMAAVMAATGWVAIPLGAVPVSLQVFGVALAALLLSPVSAGLALGAYLVLGAIGVPVFASGQAGLGVVAGPLGGYLLGFVVGAVLGALVRTFVARRASALVADIAAVVAVVLAVYALGWVQLAAVAHLSAAQAFVSGVVPFVLADAAKAAVAIAVARGVRRAGARVTA